MAAFLYEFEWDPVKAAANVTKHGLEFEQAATVFQDPLAVTISKQRKRSQMDYATNGNCGQFALVVHTFDWAGGMNGRESG